MKLFKEKRFKKGEKYIMKQKAIIFDLDGVLVASEKRFKRLDLNAFERKDKKAFVKSIEHYNADCRSDLVIDPGVDLLVALTDFYKPDRVFLLTARGDGGAKATLNWLKKENLWDSNYQLIMRPEDLDNFEFTNQQDHAIYKKRVTNELMKVYDILVCVDDNPLNCQAFRDLGLVTIQFNSPGIGRLNV
jgi:HAD superfamily hydrolase (TIGR01509 family)